jgi:hypothetical protein
LELDLDHIFVPLGLTDILPVSGFDTESELLTSSDLEWSPWIDISLLDIHLKSGCAFGVLSTNASDVVVVHLVSSGQLKSVLLVDEAFPLLSSRSWFWITLLVIFAQVEGWVVGLSLIVQTEIDQIFKILVVINVLLDSKALVFSRGFWEIFEGDSVHVLIVVSWLDLWENSNRHFLFVGDLVGVSTLFGGEQVKLSVFIRKVIWSN